MKSYYLKSIFWFLFAAAAAAYVLLTYYEKQDFFHRKQDNLTVRKFSMHVSNLKKFKFHKEYDQHTPEKLFVLENFPKTTIARLIQILLFFSRWVFKNMSRLLQ